MHTLFQKKFFELLNIIIYYYFLRNIFITNYLFRNAIQQYTYINYIPVLQSHMVKKKNKHNFVS